MSVLKVTNGRRKKVSNRIKIEYLRNKVKKMKIEKNAMAEKLHDNIEDTAIKVDRFEEELQSEKKKIDDMKKIVGCPVCLEVPRKGPVFTCSNGHLVCQKCKRETCPTCREAMGNNKCLVAITIIEKILHDCKFEECEEKFCLDNIEKHEKSCKHRVVACPEYLNCAVKMPLSNLLAHLESSQDCCDSRYRSPRIINGSFKTLCSFTVEGYKSPFLAYKLRSYCFAGIYLTLDVQKSEDSWWFVIVMFESPEVCKNLNIEIKVYQTYSPPDSRLGVKLRCHPCSIDQSPAERKGLGLVVPHRLMEQIILQEDSFEFTVSFNFF